MASLVAADFLEERGQTVRSGRWTRAELALFAEVVASKDVVRLALVWDLEVFFESSTVRLSNASKVDKVDGDPLFIGFDVPPVQRHVVDSRRIGLGVYAPGFRPESPSPFVETGQLCSVAVEDGHIGGV